MDEPPTTTVSPVTVTDLDHVVLVCSDIERSLEWYTGLLGLEPLRIDQWREGTVPFPSVRVNADTIIDLLAGDQPPGRLDHICFTLAPTDLDGLAASGVFDVVEGPVLRFGARGTGRSLYVRDPDGTLVELRCYPDD